MNVVVLLDNIRSAQNVGAIFRTCDGAGVERIVLAGYTPSPLDRFGRLQSTIAKTSLGATTSVLWESVSQEEKINYLKTLQERGYQIVVVEQMDDSLSLYEYKEGKKVVYVFGNEIQGVDPEICELADIALEIPMRGMKESLNVSVTAGIVLYYHKK